MLRRSMQELYSCTASMIPAGHQGSQQVWCLGVRLGLSLFMFPVELLEARPTGFEEKHLAESDDEDMPIAFLRQPQIRESEMIFVQRLLLQSRSASVRSWDPDSKVL